MSRRFLPIYAPTLLGCVCTVNAPYYMDDVAKGETPKEDTESQHRTGGASVDNEEIEIKRPRAELMAFFDHCGRVTQSGGLFLVPSISDFFGVFPRNCSTDSYGGWLFAAKAGA